MRKKIVSLAFLMPLVLVVLFLVSCEKKQTEVKYTLVSEMVLHALLHSDSTSPKADTNQIAGNQRQGVALRTSAGQKPLQEEILEPSLEPTPAEIESIVRLETNALHASAERVIGTCCCPCYASELQGCPCPSAFELRFIEPAASAPTEMSLNDIEYESGDADAPLGKKWRVFSLPEGTTVPDGKYTLTIKGKFGRSEVAREYKLAIRVEGGKAYFDESY